MTMDTYYFGCIGAPGHHWWKMENGCPVAMWRDFPYEFPHVLEHGADGAFAPLVPDPRDPSRFDEPANGHATLTYVAGASGSWTVLSFRDQSVDRRPKSSSLFAIQGKFGFADACKIAAARFPRVWSRFKFEVTPFVETVQDGTLR